MLYTNEGIVHGFHKIVNHEKKILLENVSFTYANYVLKRWLKDKFADKELIKGIHVLKM